MNIKQHYQVISLIFIVILITSSFLWPEKSGYTTIFILIISLVMTLALIIQRNRERIVQSNLISTAINRKVALETIVLLVIIWVSGFAGRIVERWAGSAVEQSQPGFGLYAGVVAGMAFALVAGWGMRKMWVKAVKMIARG